MLLVLAVQALAASTPQQAAVLDYQKCLAPIVEANEAAGEKNYQSLELVLERIKKRCAKEREGAREALAQVVVEHHPDLHREPTTAEKEALIHDATIRWANNVVARTVAEEK